jgi:putative Ca2+/H+ antiporter (TMEM165/GDT1 family)
MDWTRTTAAPAVAPATVVGDLGFVHAFVASLSMIIVSELGDKTFFIAAIMAMRHARLTVFTGAMAALAFMTILSALFGYAITIIPRIYTYYVSTALFALFGFKMLYDGCQMSDDEGAGELEEVQAHLRRQEESAESTPLSPDLETGIIPNPKMPSKARRILFSCFSRVFLQALTMTFLAEWGDRSQLATVVLAATEDIVGVCIGGVLGHSLCTGLAVLGGRIIAQRISVRTVTILGGVVFLVFAVSSLFLNPNA